MITTSSISKLSFLITTYLTTHIRLKSNKGLVTGRGVNTYKIRVKQNKINEQEDYTGFIMWGKKNCGKDFIDKLADGSTL